LILGCNRASWSPPVSDLIGFAAKGLFSELSRSRYFPVTHDKCSSALSSHSHHISFAQPRQAPLRTHATHKKESQTSFKPFNGNLNFSYFRPPSGVIAGPGCSGHAQALSPHQSFLSEAVPGAHCSASASVSAFDVSRPGVEGSTVWNLSHGRSQ
jgi:hypothetical protein